MKSVKFYNCRLYVSSDVIVQNAYIIVDEGRVKKYGEVQSNQNFDGFEDLHGKTVMPGFIDVNTHITIPDNGLTYDQIDSLSDGYLGALAAKNACSILEGGVTTIRDIGGINHIDIDIRNAINNRDIKGPTVLAAGKAICITGGHGSNLARSADGPKEIVKAVREQFEAGADVIKIMVSGGVLTENSDPNMQHMSNIEVSAATEESHRLGMRIAAHCQNLISVKAAVNAEVDSIEHGIYLDDEVIADMLSRGTILVPTLSAPAAICSEGVGKLPSSVIEKCQKIFDSHQFSVGKAASAGVKIAMGSDSGTPFNFHGNNRSELIHMCRCGMRFSEALRSATSVSAELLGLEHRKGKLESGFDGDMLVVKNDPCDKPETIGDIDFIQRVYRKGLQVFPNLVRGVA